MNLPSRIMRATLALAVVASLLAGIAVYGAVSAEADWNGGSLRHYAPDNGYDRPILVDCAGKTGWQRVPEGDHSDWICGPNGSEDVNRVKVRNDGEEITCWSPGVGMWLVWLDGSRDANNIKAVGNFQNLLCVIGLVNTRKGVVSDVRVPVS